MSSTRARFRTVVFVTVSSAALGLLWINRHDPADRSIAFQIEDVQINEFTASTQSRVSLDVDPEGRVFAAWDSRRQEGGTYGVRGRVLDGSGGYLTAESPLNTTTASMQQEPAVVWLGSDPLAAWVSFGQDGDGRSIVVRGRSGEEFVLNEETVGDQSELSLANLGEETAVAVWSSTDGQGRSIRGRMIDSSGRPIGSEFPINEDVTSTVSAERTQRAESQSVIHRLPTVAACADQFVVAWDRFDNTLGDAAKFEVRARVFDRTGQPLGNEFAIGAGGVDEIEPSAAMDPSGNFVLAWMHLDPETEYDPYHQRFDKNGRALSDPSPLAENVAGWQSAVCVDLNDRGEFVAAWNTVDDNGDSDIWVRTFDAHAAPHGAEQIATQTRDGRQLLTGHQGSRRIVLDDKGRVTLGWSGQGRGDDASAAHVSILSPASQDRFEPLQNSGDFSSWITTDPPAGATDEPVAAPVYDPSTTVNLPQIVEHRGGGDVGFTGITDTGWNPPDPQIAVGNNHLVLMTNGGIAAYTKGGSLLWFDGIGGGGGFWGSEGATSFVFDPEVHYDPFEDRFLAMANERSGASSFFLLGISSTGDPTDPWHKYRFNVTSIADRDIDSPNMSFDENGIYLGADFFSPNRYLFFGIDKASVLNGGAPVTGSFFHNGSHSFGMPEHLTDEADRAYMIEHFDGNQSTVRLWAIDDPSGSPTSQTIDIPVDNYLVPGVAKSRGSSVNIILFEARFWSAMYIDGSLWACHHVRVPGAVTPKARWYEIDMKGWPTSGMTPAVRQSGQIDAGDEVYLTFNSIAGDAQGNAYMVFARSGLDEFFSIARTYRLSSDPLGTMQGPDFIRESTTAYLGDRWGDYSDVQADPAEPGKFWSYHEWAVSAGSWSTWVQCETLANPASVPGLGDTIADARTLQSAPNPFTDRTELRFRSERDGDVRALIFDARGRQVHELQPTTTDGSGFLRWDGRFDDGTAAPAGIYFARVLIDGTEVASGRLVKVD